MAPKTPTATNLPDSRELVKVEENSDLKLLVTNGAKALDFAEKLQIKTEKDLESANSNLADIKNEMRRGEGVRRFFVDPYNELVKRVNAAFKPPLDVLAQAERIIKAKLVKYDDEQAKKAAKARAKLADDVNSGKIPIEKAAERMEGIQAPPKTVVSPISGASLTFALRKEIVIVDEKKLPREYLIPDMVKIRKVALAGIQIPGVEVTEKKIPQSRPSAF